MDTTKLKSKLEDKVRDLDTPTEAAPNPTVELAPLDSHYMAFRSNALTVIQENLKNQPLSFQFFDIVKSPSGGATVFSVPGLSGEEVLPQLREYIKEHQILLPDSYLKGMGSLMAKKPEEATDEHPEQNRHTKGSWYYVWKGEYEIMECFPEYLPNTYLNYYLQQKEFVEHSNPERTRANEVEETREKNLFDGIDHYEKTGEIDESTFYAGSHGDWIADLAIALKNDTKQRFLVICENKGAIPNMPYDAMVELPAYIGKNGPEVISRDNIPLFQQGLMMQQLNSEKLVVEATIEGSYEKALKAFTLNKTVPSMKVAKEVLDDMIEANKGYWPELK